MRTLLFISIYLIANSLIAQNKNISNGNIFDGEPYIAVNPNNPQEMVVAWMSFVVGNRTQIKTKFSSNNGATWSSETIVAHPVSGYTSADPSLSFDNNGNVYLSFIDFTGFSSTNVEGAVYVSKSTNLGQTWNTPTEVIHSNDDPGKLNIDRPWMVIDRSNTASDGTIYVTTMNAKGSTFGYNPYISTSTDGGSTFNWRYLDTANYLSGNVIKQPMPTPAVSGTGIVHAVYPSYVVSQNLKAQFLIASSSNSANSFAYNTVFASSSSVSDSDAKKGYLLKANPANANHLVFLFLEEDTDKADIFMVETMDAGVNWSAAIKINDDNTSAMQDLVWADFDTDGDLVVSWRDRRNGTSSDYDTDSEIWAAVRWKDSANFSPNFKISDTLVAYDNILAQSGNDFMSIDFKNDTIHTVWGDTRTGKLNIWYQRTTTNGGVVSVTNISFQTLPKVTVYPNPTQNTLHLTGKEITEISIYNSAGKLMLHRNSNTPKSNWDVNVYGFENGLYLISAKTEFGEVSLRFLKK